MSNESSYKSNVREMTKERARLSLEVLEQQNLEWEMKMDREFPNWRELRPNPPAELAGYITEPGGGCYTWPHTNGPLLIKK